MSSQRIKSSCKGSNILPLGIRVVGLLLCEVSQWLQTCIRRQQSRKIMRLMTDLTQFQAAALYILWETWIRRIIFGMGFTQDRVCFKGLIPKIHMIQIWIHSKLWRMTITDSRAASIRLRLDKSIFAFVSQKNIPNDFEMKNCFRFVSVTRYWQIMSPSFPKKIFICPKLFSASQNWVKWHLILWSLMRTLFQWLKDSNFYG